MRLVSLTWARNEEDILESFISHTASFVDHLHIILHQCTDASRKIVERLQREHVPLTFEEDDSPAHRQTEALTEFLQTLRHDIPDFVLPLDSDEFLTCKGRVRDAVAALPKHIPTLVPWKTYVPSVIDREEDDILDRMRYRRSRETPQFWKVIIPKAFVLQGNCKVAPGNHGLEGVHEYHRAENLTLAHFPVRTEKQLRRKILDGYESVLRNPARTTNEAFHWKKLVPRCSDSRPISNRELQEIALSYASTVPQEVVFDPISLMPLALAD